MTPQNRLQFDPEEDLTFGNTVDRSTFRVTPNAPAEGWGGRIVSTIAPVVDFISRPQFASAKFFDSLADDSMTIFDAVLNSFGELVNPKDKLSFSDVIKRRAPKFAEANPIATKVIGFIGDVGLDPTTYLGIGFASKGLKVGGKTLTAFGEEILQKNIASLTNRVVLTAPGGLYKEVEKEVIKAGTKGIKPTVFRVTPERFEKEMQSLISQYSDDFAKLGIDPNQGTELALKELNRTAIPQTDVYLGVKRRLSVEEVRETAEQRILRYSELQSDVTNNLFVKESGNIKLNVGVPFAKPTYQIDLPYTEKIKLLGLYPLKRSIDATSKLRDLLVNAEIPAVSNFLQSTVGLGQSVKNLFTRPGISDAATTEEKQFRDSIVELQNQYSFISSDVERSFVKLFKGVDKDRREVIGKLMRDVDDASSKFRFVNKRELNQTEADTIWQENLAKARLDSNEMRIVASLQQDYKSAMELEMEANLLQYGVVNYAPRAYQALSDPTVSSFLTRKKYGLSTFLPSSVERNFVTQADAEAAGLIPELDAAILGAQRVLSSRRALANKQFQDSIRAIYEIDDSITWGSRDMAKYLPSNIIDDMKLLGESVYPSYMNSSTKSLLIFADKLTSLFRKGATVAKPSFGFKQAGSNTAQVILQAGATAGAKLLDPRAFVDSALMIADVYRNKTTSAPRFINDIFEKFLGPSEGQLAGRLALASVTGEEALYDFAKSFSKKTALGQTYTGEDLVRVMRENGVIKGFDATGETFNKKFEEALRYDPNNKWDLTKELIQYWKYPSIVEDYSRATFFMHNIGLGMSPKQAADEVTKTLFDYQHGLSKFERDFVRRIVPFYTFQRFAIPFVLRQMVEQPGTITASQKIVQLMERLIVGEDQSMNPSEREIFGRSLYVEQPGLFTGFDNSGRAKFNVFNNMTPLDALSMFVYDKVSGEVDIERTVQKSVFAALTPFLKVPLESAIDKQFFSGKAISSAGGIGNYKGGAADYIFSSVIPKPIKEMIGWENRTNLRTGETRTYINPYLAYYSTSFVPALKQFLNLGDSSRTPLERAQAIITGIVPQNIDLREQQQWQTLGERNALKGVIEDIRTAKLRGSETQYDSNLRRYRELLNDIREGRNKKYEFAVRGQGINNEPDSNPLLEAQNLTQ